MKRFRRLPYQKDRTFTELQNNIEEVLTPLTNSEILDGVLFKNIALTTGIDNVLPHTLGRAATGAIPVLLSADVRIWTSQTNNLEPSKHVLIQTSANCTANLWVF